MEASDTTGACSDNGSGDDGMEDPMTESGSDSGFHREASAHAATSDPRVAEWCSQGSASHDVIVMSQILSVRQKADISDVGIHRPRERS